MCLSPKMVVKVHSEEEVGGPSLCFFGGAGGEVAVVCWEYSAPHVSLCVEYCCLNGGQGPH